MKPRRTLWAVAGGTFLVTFDGSAVQIILPMLRHDFHTSIFMVQWAMTAFLLVSTGAYLLAGRLGDDRGRRWVWSLGLVLFVTGSAACALAPGMGFLIGARALQALGAAAITANSAPLLVGAFPDDQARAFAWGSVAIAAGLLCGPAVGALLTRLWSWRLLFGAALPFGGIAWWLGRGHLPDGGQRRPRRLDLAGAALSALGLGGLVTALASGRTFGWHSPLVVSSLVGGVVLVGLFLLLERRRERPLLELRLFRRRAFLSGALSSLFGYLSLFTLTVAMPFFLIEEQRRGLIQAGLWSALVPVSLALAAPLAGRLSDRIGSRPVCTVGMLIVAGGLLCGTFLEAGASGWLLAATLSLAGAGLGAFEAPNSAAALGAIPGEELGSGTATLGVMRNLGMTMGSALAATLLAGTSGASATRWALLAGAVAALVAAALVLLRPGGRPAPSGIEHFSSEALSPSA